MKKALILTSAATALLLTGLTAHARTSSDAEFRGYEQCVDAAKKESRGLVTNRNYYLEQDGTNTQYYINATRWEDTKRAKVRIDRQTAVSGQRLVSADVTQGHFTLDAQPSVRVEVAQK
jgi:hypothetical protein